MLMITWWIIQRFNLKSLLKYNIHLLGKNTKSKLQTVSRGKKGRLVSSKLPSESGLIEIDGKDKRAHLIEF